jgi:RimJ/RimL family protein N-acetyltransferase
MRALATPPCPVALQRLGEDHERQRLTAVRESMADLLDAFHWCSAPYTEVANRSYIASCGQSWDLMCEFVFAVVDSCGCFVGEAALHDLDLAAGSANLSYWIAPSARRRGYGSLAAAMVARFAFRDLGLRQLRFVVAPDNLASARIARKLTAAADGAHSPDDDLRFVLDADDCIDWLRRDPASGTHNGISPGG